MVVQAGKPPRIMPQYAQIRPPLRLDRIDGDEQAAWQKEQDRYANPSVLDLWAGSADFGVALTTGNSATTTTTDGLDLARITRRDKTTVFYRQVSATDRNVAPAKKIANAKRAGV